MQTERPWDVYSPEAYHKMNSRDAGLRLPDSVKHTADPSRFMDTVNKSFHVPFFGYSRELAFLFINVFSSNPTESYIHLFNVYVKLYLQFYRLLICLIRIYILWLITNVISFSMVTRASFTGSLSQINFKYSFAINTLHVETENKYIVLMMRLREVSFDNSHYCNDHLWIISINNCQQTLAAPREYYLSNFRYILLVYRSEYLFMNEIPL